MVETNIESAGGKRSYSVAAPGNPTRVPAERSPPARGPPADGAHFPIVAIGASAGGLEAVSQLFSALTPHSGIAHILVQHLDPTHASMMVDLLAQHTAMTVVQAEEGAALAPDHLYIIPPGCYLSVRAGALHLSSPPGGQGVRLPFDLLLRSLADDVGPRAACIVLTGTGTDGTLGLPPFKQKGGLVIVQTPEEAEYDGMPNSAIATGLVDAVMPLAKMPAALLKFGRRVVATIDRKAHAPDLADKTGIPGIIAYLRKNSPHDFHNYKPGTLGRRIARRMALMAIEAGDFAHYLEALRDDPRERDILASDLLINVTRFFRDPAVFDHLESTVLPELTDGLSEHHPLRVWVAGCSTGEEAYSLAMLCRDAISASGRDIKLQVFASDLDPDAIATAREGSYPETIAEDVLPDRLARYFVKEDDGYRVNPSLRGDVVFTVQDVLTDPPFSRISLVSCRNLLIYLTPDAQAKVITLFHFALRETGILLLGGSETIANADGRFALIAKAEKVYRHIARSRIGEPGFPLSFGESIPKLGASTSLLPSRQATLAELCRRTVLETHAPAAVLIDRNRQCLYSLGPTDRYLRIVPGYPSHDLLAMATPSVRTKLRLAMDRVCKAVPRVTTGRSRLTRDGGTNWFSIDVHYLSSDGEELLLVCFIDEIAPEASSGTVRTRGDAARIAELEHELEATQTELQAAIQAQEISTQEQKAINEEAQSVNEEFQSTNEELLTSKEELQSLNEELTALNSQLQETLDRQRTTADDLQNVLYATNVATLFLDPELRIRFFTPATRSLFNVIPGDVGRPLADLRSLAGDTDLLVDARTALADQNTIEREIQAPDGTWFVRRIFPYRAHDDTIEGVVITFGDITDRKSAVKALDLARQQAERANLAKSRFLAAASHDLRQPLQSLALIQALLARTVEGEKATKLVVRLDQTLGAMSGMLNALLDINQIEAGVITAKPETFAINTLFDRLRDEFTYLAQSRKLTLRIVPNPALIHSDPRLLDQMLRNLLANAIKYTRRGKILLGCRRHGDMVRIEIWDTGIGIAADELGAIFEEFHQVDNAARERSQGLGLGLSIVQRLGRLLGHAVGVRSILDRGSVFSIDVQARAENALPMQHGDEGQGSEPEPQTFLHSDIVVIDDDPDVLDLLEQMLKAKGHIVRTATDGQTAMKLVSGGAVRPELIIADYNLPGGMTGLETLSKLRTQLDFPIPGIILTGDISTGTLAEVARQGCVQLNKPVKPRELTAAITQLLTQDGPTARAPPESSPSTIYVVEDDADIRKSIRDVLEEDGRTVEDFETAESFLAQYRSGRDGGCLLTDVGLPGISGVTLLRQLRDKGDRIPTILMTGSTDIGIAVEAMKAGACDFIEKPASRSELLASINRALSQSDDLRRTNETHQAAALHVSELTSRQHEIMNLVLAGHPSKNIAADLGISQRTVENHRAAIMHKMNAKSLPELARLALAAASSP